MARHRVHPATSQKDRDPQWTRRDQAQGSGVKGTEDRQTVQGDTVRAGSRQPIIPEQVKTRPAANFTLSLLAKAEDDKDKDPAPIEELTVSTKPGVGTVGEASETTAPDPLSGRIPAQQQLNRCSGCC